MKIRCTFCGQTHGTENRMIWLCVTQEEVDEIIFGLETIISDRAGSAAERAFSESLIARLKLSKDVKFVGNTIDVEATLKAQEGQQGG